MSESASLGRVEQRAELPYNFVVVLTDDQRFDTLWSMPIVSERLVNGGLSFPNSFVSDPLCCPDRGSILAGGYLAQNSGVLTNVPPNGGFESFEDENSLAVRLAQHGYRTGLVGKYLNGFDAGNPYVPPGWDLFQANEATSVTQELVPTAVSFFETYKDEPFFLYLATAQPHPPAIGDPQDAGLFTDYLYRERGFGESDLSDKPGFVRSNQKDHGPDASDAAAEDVLHQNVLRSLQTVDRAVGTLLDELEARDLLSRTVFFFTSDNGYLWGEHGMWGKRWAWEESVRVPFAMLMPGAPAHEVPTFTATNLDIPATMYHLANIPPVGDGKSLVPFIQDDPGVEQSLFIEDYGVDFPSQTNEVWAGLHKQTSTSDFKYVEYATGDKELYDLAADPYELSSLHQNPAYTSIRDALAAELEPQKGVAIRAVTAAMAKPGARALPVA